MNIAFILDNSITMNQLTYNGLSILQYAKAYIQKIIEVRSSGLKTNFDSKPEIYHLFKTSSIQPLSSYQHQQLHFFSQLKLIKTEVITEVSQVLRKAFWTVNRYRIASGSENLFGYIQPFNSSSSLIILLTDSGDESGIKQIKQYLQNNQLLNRYDNQFWIIKICPPARKQKNTNIDNCKKMIEKQNISKTMSQICQYLNGQVKYVFRYEHGFQILQSIISGYRYKISFKLELIELNSSINFFRQSGIKITRANKSNSIFLKQNEFIMTHLIRSPQKKYTRIPFPECIPKVLEKTINQFNSPQIECHTYPQYLIDFSKAFDFPMHQYMPFQKIQIDNNELFKQVIQKMKNDKIYFPVYFNHQEFHYLLIGLLKITKLTQTIQFFVYLANFVEFSPIFDHIIAKKPINKQLQLNLNEYSKKIPFYYQKYLLNILTEKGIKKQYNLKISQKLFQKEIILNEKIQKIQRQERKNANQKFKINYKLHNQYDTQCCPIYSKKYAQYSKAILYYKQNCIVTNTFQTLVSSVINLKMDLFNISKNTAQDQIYRIQYDVTPVTKGVQMFKIAEVQGDQQLGNPFKKRRKQSEVFKSRDEKLNQSNIKSGQNIKSNKITGKEVKQNQSVQNKEKKIRKQILSQTQISKKVRKQQQQIRIEKPEKIFIQKICRLFQSKRKIVSIKINSINLNIQKSEKNKGFIQKSSL